MKRKLFILFMSLCSVSTFATDLCLDITNDSLEISSKDHGSGRSQLRPQHVNIDVDGTMVTWNPILPINMIVIKDDIVEFLYYVAPGQSEILLPYGTTGNYIIVVSTEFGEYQGEMFIQ